MLPNSCWTVNPRCAMSWNIKVADAAPKLKVLLTLIDGYRKKGDSWSREMELASILTAFIGYLQALCIVILYRGNRRDGQWTGDTWNLAPLCRSLRQIVWKCTYFMHGPNSESLMYARFANWICEYTVLITQNIAYKNDTGYLTLNWPIMWVSFWAEEAYLDISLYRSLMSWS